MLKDEEASFSGIKPSTTAGSNLSLDYYYSGISSGPNNDHPPDSVNSLSLNQSPGGGTPKSLETNGWINNGQQRAPSGEEGDSIPFAQTRRPQSMTSSSQGETDDEGMVDVSWARRMIEELDNEATSSSESGDRPSFDVDNQSDYLRASSSTSSFSTSPYASFGPGTSPSNHTQMPSNPYSSSSPQTTPRLLPSVTPPPGSPSSTHTHTGDRDASGFRNADRREHLPHGLLHRHIAISKTSPVPSASGSVADELFGDVSGYSTDSSFSSSSHPQFAIIRGHQRELAEGFSLAAPPGASSSRNLRDGAEFGDHSTLDGQSSSKQPKTVTVAHHAATDFSNGGVVNHVVDLDQDSDAEERVIEQPPPSQGPWQTAAVEEPDVEEGEEDYYRRTREPGVDSPALRAARERARKARSLHLAATAGMAVSPPSVGAGGAGDPPLSSRSWTSEDAPSRRVNSGLEQQQSASPENDLPPPTNIEDETQPRQSLTVERPTRSEMRSSRTPSPSGNAREPYRSLVDSGMASPPGPAPTLSHFREPATDERASPITPAATMATSTAASSATAAFATLSDAQTLEELTAAVDRAINDTGTGESLALRNDFSPRASPPPHRRTAAQLKGGDVEEYVLVSPPKPSRPKHQQIRRSSEEVTARSSRVARVSTPPASSAVGPKRTVVRRTSSLASLTSLLDAGAAAKAPPLTSSIQANANASAPPLTAARRVGSSTTLYAQSTASALVCTVGQLRPWPNAMLFTDIRSLRSPGEKAQTYARKINELAQSDTGLKDWIRYKNGQPLRNSCRPSIATASRHVSSPDPASLGQGRPSFSSFVPSVPTIPGSRNVSSSSAFSEDFPLRQGCASFQAQQIRNVSPPSGGPPPNLPYPQLAIGLGKSSSTASLASRASNSTTGFFAALGRRGSASNGSKFVKAAGQSKSPPANLATLPQSRRESLESPGSGSVFREMGAGPPLGIHKAGMGQGSHARTGGPGPSGPRVRNSSLQSSSNLTALAVSSDPAVPRASVDFDRLSRHSPPPPSHTPPYSLPLAPLAEPEAQAHLTGTGNAKFDRELREMVELLDEDERVLGEYLKRNGDYMTAIGAYLADQKRGQIFRI